MSTTPRAAKFFVLAISLVSLVFCISVEPARATVVLENTFAQTANTGVIGAVRQVRVDPADGKVYVLGSSTSVMNMFSADGSTVDSLNFSAAQPASTGGDFVVSNSTLFIITSAGSNGRNIRYDVSGTTANVVASVNATGSGAITFGAPDTLYINRSNSVVQYDYVLSKLAPTSTISATAVRLAYGNGQLFYFSSTGNIVSSTPGVSDTTIRATGITGSNTKGLSVAADGSAVYYASNTGFGKIVASSGDLLWSVSVSNLSGMDLNTSTGKIYTVNASGTIKIYNPITSVASFTATSSGSDVTLDITSGTDSDYGGTMIRRSTVSYPASVTDGSAVTTTASNTYVDSDLSNGTYYYAAFNKTIDGYYGQGVTTSVTVAVPPDPPVVAATLTGVNNVSLSWTMPARTESFLLKRSTITYPLTTSDGSTVTTTGDISLVDSGLSDGTYYYSVFARDAQGNYSSPGTASKSIDTAGPNTPSNFTASASGSTVNLSWTNPGDSDFSYESIRRGTTSSPATPSDGTAVTTTIDISYADTGLSNGTYYYSIFAYDATGNYSNVATSSATVNVVASSPAAESPGTSVVFMAPSAVGSSGASLSFGVGGVSKSGVVSLLLNADPRTVKGYAVSLDPYFKDASISPFNSTTKIGTTQLPNRNGTYKLYLKYYSLTGQASDTLTQIVVVSGASVSTVSSVVSPPVAITRVLSSGSTGSDVKALQQFLNARGFTVSVSGAGSPGKETTVFGPATTKALTKFQEAYADQILKPLGLKKGTGVLGSATMKVVESLKSL